MGATRLCHASSLQTERNVCKPSAATIASSVRKHCGCMIHQGPLRPPHLPGRQQAACRLDDQLLIPAPESFYCRYSRNYDYVAILGPMIQLLSAAAAHDLIPNRSRDTRVLYSKCFWEHLRVAPNTLVLLRRTPTRLEKLLVWLRRSLQSGRPAAKLQHASKRCKRLCSTCLAGTPLLLPWVWRL